MLLDFLLSLELLAIFSKFLKLILFAFTLSAGLLLCVLGHLKLILQALLHIFGSLSLVADGVILSLELRDLPPELLAH
jgi:hypothetical protein